MIVYLGIDPGVTGAVVELHQHEGRQEIVIHPAPTVWVERAKGKKRRRYDLDAIDSLMHGLGRDVAICYVEEQTARPGQGVTSMFSIGFGAGMWLAFLTAYDIPHVIVRPQRWRAAVGLHKPADKKAIKTDVRAIAARRFPGTPIHLDHADAVMLAVAASLDNGLVRKGA